MYLKDSVIKMANSHLLNIGLSSFLRLRMQRDYNLAYGKKERIAKDRRSALVKLFVRQCRKFTLNFDNKKIEKKVVLLETMKVIRNKMSKALDGFYDLVKDCLPWSSPVKRNSRQ